jgi:thioredoxin reductase (NADPH)
MQERFDFVIIGAGPIGLACAIAARRSGQKAIVIEKGALVNSIVHYPTDLEFFSTPELLEIGGYPFPTRNYKPRRAEVIEYYRQVAFTEHIELRLYETVIAVEGEEDRFTVQTDKGAYACRRVIVSTGFFDIPILMNIPGEDLPKVSHYYAEPFMYSGTRVAVIGGANSAAKTVLDLYRHGAEVTLIHRGPTLSRSVKYWIRPDLENRIKEGSIPARFDSTVVSITPEAVVIRGDEGEETIPNDWVLAMTGYRPNFEFLAHLGIQFADDEHRTPVHNPETMETNRAGMYLAGVVCGGMNTRVWFIENSRVHADVIMRDAT